jgi:hypothetical protein
MVEGYEQRTGDEWVHRAGWVLGHRRQSRQFLDEVLNQDLSGWDVCMLLNKIGTLNIGRILI